jgi:addiction module HigA family antidote
MGRTARHPGEHLAEQLEALDISAAELGRRLQVPGNRISQIVTGHRAITGDTALRLGHFFGTGPQFWLNLQAAYDLRLAEEKTGATIKSLPTLTTGHKRHDDDHQPAA